MCGRCRGRRCVVGAVVARYLNVGGAFFGVRRALLPVVLSYGYNNGSVWCTNSRGASLDEVVASLVARDATGVILLTEYGVTMNIADGTSEVCARVVRERRCSG